MSLRDVYEAVLVEMNKENAPNILLEDFNLLTNKAINQYVNKRYNIYEINQQVGDDLSVLKGSKTYTSFTSPSYGSKSKIYKGIYGLELPQDYFHILNCTCTFEILKNYRCYDLGDIFEIGATKLTADAWNQVVNNFWNKPTYRRPYFYIHPGDLSVEDKRNSTRNANDRDGHSQSILCEIRVGTDKQDVFKLSEVTIDYLKVPMFYRLTQSLIDSVVDTSDTLEFPDYVCWEIINELVHIIMENIGDLRILTHPVVSLSIANPAQQLTEPVAL